MFLPFNLFVSPQFATGAIKAILSTPADEQKCIREQISKAIAGEASSCLAKKVPNFAGVPDIPDLEEGAFAIREQVERNAFHFYGFRAGD